MAGTTKGFRTIDIVLCGLFAALTAVGAFLKITLPTEPYAFSFSLQWLFVLLAALLLGCRLATMSVGTYLVIGLIGVPVFAHGGGPQYVLRAGFGFLLGFLLAAFLMGLLVERLPKRIPELVRLLISSVVGLVAYYLVGTCYYYLIITYVNGAPEVWSFGIAVVGCLTTFLPDLALCVIASLITLRLRPVLMRTLHL